MRFKLTALVCLVLATHDSSSLSLPSITDFLALLFNVSPKDVSRSVASFVLRNRSTDGINFLLYSNSSRNETKWSPVNHTDIDQSKPTVFYIAGWRAACTGDAVDDVAEEYSQNGPFNVIAVNWTILSKQNYIAAAGDTQTAGVATGNFITRLVAGDLKYLKKIQIVGHSLGGQVAGFAGKHVTNCTGGNVSRIFGLDPAGPLFEFPVLLPKYSRLTKSDADVVQVIHTNKGFMGFHKSIGSVDFYVAKGGPIQPGCLSLSISKNLRAFQCSHSLAHDYFAQSINSDRFVGVSCANGILYDSRMCNGNSRAVMGPRTPSNVSGVFYMEANQTLPKGIGILGFKVL